MVKIKCSPEKLGPTLKTFLDPQFRRLDSYFLEIQEPIVRSDKWFPNFTANSCLGVQTSKQGIPKLSVNLFITLAPGLKELFLIENSDRSTFQPDLTVLVKPPKDQWKSDNLREPLLRRLFLEPSLLEKNTVKHSYPLSVFLFYLSVRLE